MDKREKLLNQLIVQTEQKSWGFKLFVWGIVLGIVNLIFDSLYNILRFLSERGDLGIKGRSVLSFFKTNFLTLLTFWLLLWIGAIVLVTYGLTKWLNSRGEIEKVKLELETLK